MEVVVDALEPTVSFDTVGISVHNVSTENFTGPDTHRGRLVPLRSQVPCPAPTPAPAPSGSRFSPRNWRVPTRLNAILLIPVVVGLVMGGFQVKSSIDTWQEAQDAEKTARLVQAALNYGDKLFVER